MTVFMFGMGAIFCILLALGLSLGVFWLLMTVYETHARFENHLKEGIELKARAKDTFDAIHTRLEKLEERLLTKPQ